MSLPITVLSLGWGVQSWTLAAMMALNEYPRADLIIHADTTYERTHTYDFARKWTPWLGEHGITPVIARGKRNGVVLQEKGGRSVMIPAFTLGEDGSRGQVRRQCTHDWKIMPIRRAVRAYMDERGVRRSPGSVQMLTGITMDEWQRMRDSDVKYIENVYPFIQDLQMTRMDCITWCEQHNLEVPRKSACTFCPYSSRKTWAALKREGGHDWNEAVAVDANIRAKRGKQLLEVFVHSARMPLPEAVNIPEDVGASQPSFDDIDACDSGYCWT